MICIHASCIAIGARSILLSGVSGAGKSDLALRMIDRGARLVSDDYTEIRLVDGALVAQPPKALRGKIEVRGMGIATLDHVARVPVALFVALDEAPVRLPEQSQFEIILGIAVRKVALAGLEPSAPIKLEMILARFAGEV